MRGRSSSCYRGGKRERVHTFPHHIAPLHIQHARHSPRKSSRLRVRGPPASIAIGLLIERKKRRRRRKTTTELRSAMRRPRRPGLYVRRRGGAVR